MTVTILAAEVRSQVGECQFDWYAATIRDDLAVILDKLCAELGGEVKAGNPKQGYARGDTIWRDGSKIVTIFSGGRNGHPHAFASSDDAPAFAAAVRKFWPTTHYVTRADAKFDYDGPGTWEKLLSVLVGLGEDRGLKMKQDGDWLKGEDGRTFYLGAPSSAVRVLLYEKGKELIEKSLDGGKGISRDLVRLEARVRPDGPARYRAAVADPVELFGYAKWSQELIKLVEGSDVERVHLKERRESDHERAMFWVVQQYGKHLLDEALELGGWDFLAASLERRVLAMLEPDSAADPGPDSMPHTFDGFLRAPGPSRPF